MKLPKSALTLSALISLTLRALPALGDSLPATPVEELKIRLTEMKVQAEGAADGAPVVLKAGVRYRLTFENRGTIEHEVLIGRGLTHDEEEHELDYQEHLLATTETVISGSMSFEEGAKTWYAETPGFKELELEEGTSLSLLFTVPENARGTWEIGCFAPGHHPAGMHLPLIIE